MYQRAAGSYRRGFLNHSLSQELRDALLAAPDEAAVQQLLFPNFAQFALASFADEISAYRSAEVARLPCSATHNRGLKEGPNGCLLSRDAAAVAHRRIVFMLQSIHVPWLS